MVPVGGWTSSCSVLATSSHGAPKKQKKTTIKLHCWKRNPDLSSALIRKIKGAGGAPFLSFGCPTHKVLLDVGEVFAVLLQRLLEQVGLGRAPLLHLVPAQHGAPLRHQRRDGPGHVVAGGVQRVHGVELREGGGGVEVFLFLVCFFCFFWWDKVGSENSVLVTHLKRR